MAIKLSSNPTCVLSDADNLTAEQRQKINMNLTKGIPGSDIEGDKVTVINSDGEVEMKAYSAGGGGGTEYVAGEGIDITNDVISVANPVPSVGGHTGEFLRAGSNGPEWVKQAKVEYANQELKVRPPYGAPSLIIDTSDATPVIDTEPYLEGTMDYSTRELIVAFSGGLGKKDLVSCTLSIVGGLDATGITLGNLELNYYRIDPGEDTYTEEPISPMVVTGATSANPSEILEGDYVVPIVPNPDPSYPDLCVKITYSGSPDPADLEAFVNSFPSGTGPWGVYGDKRVASGSRISIKNYTAGDGIAISDSNVISCTVQLPAWDSVADEGKVLKIVSGNPTWVTP